ncbi:MAG: FAD-binding oxidoreductase [Vulcanimicrobiota bacterium]
MMNTHSNSYTRLTSELVDGLKAIVGEDHVIFNDDFELEPFSHDEIREKEYFHMPEAVLRPRTKEEISQILRLANSHNFPVTPRGAGSGLSGGAVPIHGGAVLLFDRMNSILEYDKDNMTITVEPGVITNEINEMVRADGLYYAGYPLSYQSCTIGGNVAENAGGGKAVKYGVTGRYVVGIQCVTPLGDIIECGGKRVKDVTGYDLVHLLTGSEGTLAVFTAIILRLIPLPEASTDLLVPFNSVDDAIAAVPAIIRGGRVIPASIEFMDRLSVEITCQYLNEVFPAADAEATLLITFEGAGGEAMDCILEKVGEICCDKGAADILVADTRAKSERLWKVRSSIADAINARTTYLSVEDIVVPIAQIPELVKAISLLAQKHGMLIPCYGHAGDGNLHATPLKPDCWSVDEWHERIKLILEELYRITISLGGTISGEHGIGHKRKGFLGMVFKDEVLELMKSIKRAFDPQNILNPGKIFDL